jgi:hypothetical protein
MRMSGAESGGMTAGSSGARRYDPDHTEKHPFLLPFRRRIMKEEDTPMKKKGIAAALGGLILAATALTGPAAPGQEREDARELVKLPPMMQRHMLANMRDHLKALNAILDDLSRGDVTAAAEVAEKRLGLSSLALHGSGHLAQFMPEGMKAIGLRLHKAASRFVIVAKDAELEPDRKALHETYAALKEITDACIACHDIYRLR